MQRNLFKWTGREGATEPSRKMNVRVGEEEGEVAGSSILTVNIYMVLRTSQALS